MAESVTSPATITANAQNGYVQSGFGSASDNLQTGGTTVSAGTASTGTAVPTTGWIHPRGVN